MGEHNIIFFDCVNEMFKDMKYYNNLHSKVYPTTSTVDEYFEKVFTPIKFKKISKKLNPIIGNSINIQTRFKEIEPNKLTDNYNNVRPYVENHIKLYRELLEIFMALANKLNLYSKNHVEYPPKDYVKEATVYIEMRNTFLERHEELLEIMSKNR